MLISLTLAWVLLHWYAILLNLIYSYYVYDFRKNDKFLIHYSYSFCGPLFIGTQFIYIHGVNSICFKLHLLSIFCGPVKQQQIVCNKQSHMLLMCCHLSTSVDRCTTSCSLYFRFFAALLYMQFVYTSTPQQIELSGAWAYVCSHRISPGPAATLSLSVQYSILRFRKETSCECNRERSDSLDAVALRTRHWLLCRFSPTQTSCLRSRVSNGVILHLRGLRLWTSLRNFVS